MILWDGSRNERFGNNIPCYGSTSCPYLIPSGVKPRPPTLFFEIIIRKKNPNIWIVASGHFYSLFYLLCLSFDRHMGIGNSSDNYLQPLLIQTRCENKKSIKSWTSLHPAHHSSNRNRFSLIIFSPPWMAALLADWVTPNFSASVTWPLPSSFDAQHEIMSRASTSWRCFPEVTTCCGSSPSKLPALHTILSKSYP